MGTLHRRDQRWGEQETKTLEINSLPCVCVCVACVCVCVCLYERGHSSLNGPLLQAAISLEPPRPPHDFLRYSLRNDREGQTLSIPLCFFLTVFSAHDSRALWVISTLQHPS